MPTVNKEMVCPGCGASISSKDTVCESCGRKLVITSLTFKEVRKATFEDSSKFLDAYKGALKNSPDSPEILTSLGYVLLDRGQYQEAADTLNKAMANGGSNPDTLFTAVIAQYKSKKPFQIKLKEAEELISKLDSAIAMSQKPEYFLLKAELIKSLFEKRYVKYKESSATVMQLSTEAGLTEADKMDVHSLLTE